MNWSEWISSNGFEGLFEVDQSLPPEFGELTWKPSDEDRAASWQLLTELRTRVATQSLHHGSGDEAAALKSVYDLFELTRSAIRDNKDASHFATLTVWVLNRCVRPFTARWHKESVEGKLSNADVRFGFRAELRQLQPSLRQLARLLALICGDETFDKVSLTPPRQTTQKNVWQSVKFGIPVGAPCGHAREAINSAESEEIARRRSKSSVNSAPGVNAVGLAISGGGIRSATFALGVLQHLGRRGILRQVDYMSTVSGGGYIGGFLSSFLNSSNASLDPGTENLPFGAEGDNESTAVRQLRNHSKYLAEGGVRTVARIISLVAYGVLVSALMLAPFLMVSVLISIQGFHEEFYSGKELFEQGILWGAAAVLGAGVLLLPIAQRSVRWRSFWENACIVLGASMVFLVVVRYLPVLFGNVRGNAAQILVAAVSFVVSIGSAAVSMGLAKWVTRAALILVAIVGPLLMIALYFFLLQVFADDLVKGRASLWLWGLTGASMLYAAFAVNINTASPHPFYRSRLARTYLVKPGDSPNTIVIPPEYPLLSKLGELGTVPYHIINCAINVPSSKEPQLRGRNTDFFIFSKRFCGSPISGYAPTSAWESFDPQLNLATAVAISAAAAAPNMGTATQGRFRFLIALLNIRLGYWLRRPTIAPKRWTRWFRVPGFQYYVRELLGVMNENSAYVNLSDGGHIENLGVYELLRRRCKFIIAIDGEADPERSFGGLLTLTQYAKIDLNVTIEPDLTDLRVDAAGNGRAHFGVARIDYPGGELGLLLYIKSSLTGNESEFLRKFHREHPEFPHQSTAQQLYSETQFEAYRELGEHVARDLFREDLVGIWDTNGSVEKWYRQLWANFGSQS